jgi:phospholipase/carboxylesterase
MSARGEESALAYREREARAVPDGLLVLHHGRGTDELDLLGLADALDPRGRLHVVSVRAPLQLAGSPGYHWYLVPRVGHPDPDTFESARTRLARFHDELWLRTGIGPERTVLAGFSMGAAMSYALSLSAGRPAPAGTLAFSGFLPTVTGWRAELASRQGLGVFIAHGRRDPVIDVAFAREAEQVLRESGLEVEYHEFEGGHQIDPAHVELAHAWLARRVPANE